MDEIVIIQELAALKRKNWVDRFNILTREYGNISDAAFNVWNEFNVEGNPYLYVLPSPQALFFSLLTFIPNRAEGIEIASGPTPITWDSTPIYETLSNWWNAAPVWTCAEWENWHRALESYYNDTYSANSVWEQAWNHPDNQCTWTGCPQTSLCAFDCDFVEYLASKDIDVSNLLSSTTCSLTNIVLNIVQTAQNVTETVVTVSETTKKVFPFLIAAAIAAGTYKIYQGL